MRVVELCDLLTPQSTPEYVGDTWMTTCSWSLGEKWVTRRPCAHTKQSADARGRPVWVAGGPRGLAPKKVAVAAAPAQRGRIVCVTRGRPTPTLKSLVILWVGYPLMQPNYGTWWTFCNLKSFTISNCSDKWILKSDNVLFHRRSFGFLSIAIKRNGLIRKGINQMIYLYLFLV